VIACYIPICIALYCLAERIFVFINYDPINAQNAQTYLYYRIPGTIFNTQHNANFYFVIGTGKSKYLLYTHLCSLPFDLILTYFLAITYDLGFIGIAISKSIVEIIEFFVLWIIL
jgi:Na+-driven multidrug efflux pump